MARGQETRTRILDVAEEAVLAKGFEATSIDEIVSAVDITKSGFFYHYPDKTALACALLERYIETEKAMFDDLFARARDLSDDPLHSLLIGLKLFAEMMNDLPKSHPGCLIASACYQDRLFDARVRDLNKYALLAWRKRFHGLFEEIAALYPPHEPVDLNNLGDMVSGVVEGGIILSRALEERHAIADQILLFRTYVKLLFLPRSV